MIYLYGIIHHNKSVDFGHIGFELDSKQISPVCTIVKNDLACVIGSSPCENFKNLSREKIVQFLLDHQKTLELIMKQFFILPFKFGTMLNDANEIEKILITNSDFLTNQISQLKDCFEINVLGTWEVKDVLSEIANEDEEIKLAKQEAQNNNIDPMHVGILLSQSLKSKAQKYNKKIIDRLKLNSENFASHDLLNDSMVINCSFLVNKLKEKEFFDALDCLDKEFNSRLNFKCIGPTPPHSFATINIRHFNPDDVINAAQKFNLNNNLEINSLKKAYKELSKKYHPDFNPDCTKGEFEQINKAYELLLSFCKYQTQSLTKENILNYIQLELSCVKNGENL
jgi:hypothetical protein